jgi:hypothetical protein
MPKTGDSILENLKPPNIINSSNVINVVLGEARYIDDFLTP